MKLMIPNNPGFTGVSYGLRFNKGVSEDTENKDLVSRLCKRGYALVEEPVVKGPITEEEIDVPEDLFDDAEPAIDFEAMTVAELKEFAKANEIDLGAVTKKAEILELLKAQ